MTKIEQIRADIEEFSMLLNDDSVPQDEKDMAKEEIDSLRKELESLEEKDKPKKSEIKEPIKIKGYDKLSSEAKEIFDSYESDDRDPEVVIPILDSELNKVGFELEYDLSYTILEVKKIKPTKTKSGKTIIEDDEPDCIELLKKYREKKKQSKQYAKKPKPTIGQQIKKVADKVSEKIDKKEGVVPKKDRTLILKSIKEMVESISDEDRKDFIKELIQMLKQI